MSNDALPEEWEILRDWLPENLNERARGAGHVPKSDDESARAWMQAKILTSLLLERLLLEAKIFSPWGYELRDDQSLADSAGSA